MVDEGLSWYLVSFDIDSRKWHWWLGIMEGSHGARLLRSKDPGH